MKITLENCQKIVEQFIPIKEQKIFDKNVIFNMLQEVIFKAQEHLLIIFKDEIDPLQSGVIFKGESRAMVFDDNTIFMPHFIFTIEFTEGQDIIKEIQLVESDQDFLAGNRAPIIYLTPELEKLALESFKTRYTVI